MRKRRRTFTCEPENEEGTEYLKERMTKTKMKGKARKEAEKKEEVAK